MKKSGLLIFSMLLGSPAMADYLSDLTIVKQFTQSSLDSNAHLIQVDKTLPAQCDGNRIYIPIEDRELYSAALANYISGQKIDLIYVLNGSPKIAE